MPPLPAPQVAKTPGDALAAPAEGGNERSRIDRGRRWSAYTGAKLHPAERAMPMSSGLALVVGAAWSAARRPAGTARRR